MFNLRKKQVNSNNAITPRGLHIETLEERRMLSGVSIFAAGDLGGEQFALNIEGQTAEVFTVTQELSTFEFQTEQPLTADQISIEFLNDQFDPANGIDSNLSSQHRILE